MTSWPSARALTASSNDRVFPSEKYQGYRHVRIARLPQAIGRLLSSAAQSWTIDCARLQIEDVVTGIYNTRIDRLPPHEQENAGFALLVAIAVPNETPALVKVSRGLSVYQTSPIAIGSGQTLAKYLIATLLWGPHRCRGHPRQWHICPCTVSQATSPPQEVQTPTKPPEPKSAQD